MQELVRGTKPDASFRVLSDVARLLVSESDLNHLLDAVADAVFALIPYDSLIIYEADISLRQLRPVLARDQHADEIIQNGLTMFGDGITGSAAERREAALVNDLDLDPRARQIPGTPLEEESMLTVPLLAREELKGMLSLYRLGRGKGFRDDELELAERFAEMAALAIDNAQIRDRLQSEIVTDHLTGLYNHRYFQERLAEELQRCARMHRPMSVALIDIDDFKRVNEQAGHLGGDHVLGALATLMRADARPGDIVCRVAGEEFAIIMPATATAEAVRVAETLRSNIADTRFNGSTTSVTISAGVAEGPSHAAGPRELMACANYALLQAKAAGGDGVAAYIEGEWSGVRAVPDTEVRMVGHLKVLQAVSAQLNRLLDVREIGLTVIRELRKLIDYHNCRVHLLDSAGEILIPVAFHGELTEYEGETYEALLTQMGEGITGRVAQTGESIYAADANQCEFAVLIPGTLDVDESILTVPMKFDDRVIGTIAVSKLGLNQFDADDLRLLESLASHAAVAFQNARLFEEQRQSAETANSLLRVSQALTRSRDPRAVLSEVVGSLSELLGGIPTSAWMRSEDGSFRCGALVSHTREEEARLLTMAVPPEVADANVHSTTEPFCLSAEEVAQIPLEVNLYPQGRPMLIAPVRWEPDGLGTLVAVGEDTGYEFTPRDLRLARGISDLASLAMGNATRFEDLEKAFLQTVEVLANALEAKDEYTSGHAREVSELAMTVGAEMGMNGEELRILELAGMFHDIGKIGVSSEIIQKPGPLDDTEMQAMKQHPQIGEQILGPVRFLHPVRPIVRSCHERWDGGGYPDGLAGEEIPLGSRIILVCDAFHAMTSDRSYRKALPQKEALRQLREAADSQFDPKVVDAFLRCHSRGEISSHSQ